MLRKLLKYELLATARVFGACYLGLAALSLLAGLSMNFPATSNNIVGGILLTAYICMLFAVMLFTFLTIIRRFYQNLLGGEGYLMNTLPVHAWQLVTSKLIAALVWAAASIIMAGASFFLLTFASISSAPILLASIGEIFNQLSHLPLYFEASTGTSFWMFLFQMLVLLLVEGISSICRLYTSCMVGHQFRRWRVAASIIAYFLISFAVSALMDLIPWIDASEGVLFVEGEGFIHFSSQFWALLPTEAVLGALFFAVTSYLLEKRLNLD